MLGAQQTDFLHLFLRDYGALPLDRLYAMLELAVRHGNGAITTPELGLHSPATDMYEIECLGINAKGFDKINAARNWLKVAQAQMYPEGAI